MSTEQGPLTSLSKRERQVMDVLFRLGQATVGEVQSALAASLNYNAVRGMLRVLTEKGLIGYRQDGVRYVYHALVPKDEAAESALAGLVQTFFEGSVEQAVATLLSKGERNLTSEELDRLAALIDQARKERGR
ncbi:MAG: BlaI/MecI/CopY family transcriptional regulator [Armatimonadetes bacterium]|nr:BlaI/MecI/CopY family transcriptional regulator [Armatimonadota bacterium]